jgi:hypothetical protein
MSNGKLSIDISGGTSNFGNISQGDGNTNIIKSQKLDTRSEQALPIFFRN